MTPTPVLSDRGGVVSRVRALIADEDRFTQITTALSGVMAYALSVLSGPILSRSLEASGRGDLAAVVGPTQLIGFALLLGLPLAAMYHAHDHDHGDLISNSWTVAAVVGIPVAAAFWVFAPHYLSDHAGLTVGWFRVYLVMAVVFVPMSVSLELLRTRPRMLAFNSLRNLPLVLNTVVLVALWLAGSVTLTTALWSQLGAMIVSYLLVFAVGGWRWRPHRTKVVVLRKQIRYGLQVWAGSVSSLIINRIDQFLLVGFVHPEALGHYVVAVTGSSVSGPVGVAFGLTLFPKIRSIEDPDTRLREMWRAFRLTILASGTIALLMGVTAPWVFPAVFGNDFRASVPLLWILLPGQVMADLASVFVQYFMAAGRPAVGSRALGVAAVVTVVTLVAMVGPLGVTGAAISTSLAEAALLAYMWIQVHRPIPSATALPAEAPELEREVDR